MDKVQLRAIRNLPKLRTLYIELMGVESFDLKHMPKIERLKSLTLRGMPTRVEGFESLSQKTPRSNMMTIQSDSDWIDRRFPKLPKLESLHLYLERLPSSLDLAQLKKLSHLSLSGNAFDDDVVMYILAQLSNLKYLNLSRSSVSDRILEAISAHQSLLSVDLSHTKISEDAFATLRENRYNMKIYPTLKDVEAIREEVRRRGGIKAKTIDEAIKRYPQE